MESTIEFLTPIDDQGSRRRRWPDDLKARIVSESLQAGITVNEVALRHGIKANRLSAWRTLARKGQLVLPEPGCELDFAPLVLEASDIGSDISSGLDRPEIMVGAVTIRLEAGASARRIAAVARSLVQQP